MAVTEKGAPETNTFTHFYWIDDLRMVRTLMYSFRSDGDKAGMLRSRLTPLQHPVTQRRDRPEIQPVHIYVGHAYARRFAGIQTRS